MYHERLHSSVGGTAEYPAAIVLESNVHIFFIEQGMRSNNLN